MLFLEIGNQKILEKIWERNDSWKRRRRECRDGSKCPAKSVKSQMCVIYPPCGLGQDTLPVSYPLLLPKDFTTQRRVELSPPSDLDNLSQCIMALFDSQ